MEPWLNDSVVNGGCVSTSCGRQRVALNLAGEGCRTEFDAAHQFRHKWCGEELSMGYHVQLQSIAFNGAFRCKPSEFLLPCIMHGVNCQVQGKAIWPVDVSPRNAWDKQNKNWWYWYTLAGTPPLPCRDRQPGSTSTPQIAGLLG